MRRYSGTAYAFAALAALSLAACKPTPSPEAATPAAETAAAPTPAAETTAPAASTPAPSQFAGKVWEVKESATVEKGTTYAFIADGTLVIDGPGGTPLQAQWTFDGGQLTLIEEGQSYPTDILKLDASEFRIRSHNPGQPVEVLLVPAADQTLPTVQPKTPM
ncbi:hypothetical protein [Lysobacter sp. cf310]|uniref:hypothetical protein n=1 Tax=Lysobacter sp. cf310 TaxID=1761790 RepID=UPI0008E03086|nr:hypothetical protein [Lysobacter sp. cf310]SFK47893.1 hypothetical protein SAMN04487938_1003 [Lysobacter sp. cf310]